MRAVELPDGIDREIIVVDDGSTDGTRDVLRQLGDSTVRVVMHDGEPRARARRSAPGSSTSTGDSCSSRTPTSSTTPRTGPSCSRRCCAGKAQVVYGSRFTGERRNMLFLHWVGNRFLSLVTNVLYNTTLSDMETCYKLFDRARARRHHAPVRPLRLRARDHREDPARGASASTRCRSRTPAASSTRARRSPGATASRRCGRSSSTASSTDAASDHGAVARAGPRSSSTTRPAPLLTECVRVAARRHERRRGPRSSSSTTARPTARSPRCARAFPDVARGRRRRATSGTRAAANLGIAATRRAGRRGAATPTSTVEPGTAAAMLARASTPSPASPRVGPAAPQPRRLATTRRRAHVAGRPVAVGHAAARPVVADEPLHPSVPPARRRPATSRATSTGCRARAVWLRRERARRGRRLGRALLHVHGGRRPLLAAAPRRVAGRVRAGGRGRCTCRARAPRGTRTG